MGLLAAIKRIAVSFLVAFNWAYALLSRRPKLHAARFARVDELFSLYVKFKSGVRIFVLSDSCHSGTSAKQLPSFLNPGALGNRSCRDGAVARWRSAAPRRRSSRCPRASQSSHPSSGA